MNTLQARAVLEKLAPQSGLRVSTASSIGDPSSWVCSAIGEGAELRLAWLQADERLTLEVSHGSPSRNVSGWLLLYGEVCVAQELPEPECSELNFENCVSYGLDLMAPRQAQ